MAWKEQGSGAWKFLKDKDGYAQKEWLKIGEDWYLFGDNSINDYRLVPGKSNLVL